MSGTEESMLALGGTGDRTCGQCHRAIPASNFEIHQARCPSRLRESPLDREQTARATKAAAVGCSGGAAATPPATLAALSVCWTCSECTLVNDSGEMLCAACGRAQPFLTSSPPRRPPAPPVARRRRRSTAPVAPPQLEELAGSVMPPLEMDMSAYDLEEAVESVTKATAVEQGRFSVNAWHDDGPAMNTMQGYGAASTVSVADVDDLSKVFPDENRAALQCLLKDSGGNIESATNAYLTRCHSLPVILEEQQQQQQRQQRKGKTAAVFGPVDIDLTEDGLLAPPLDGGGSSGRHDEADELPAQGRLKKMKVVDALKPTPSGLIIIGDDSIDNDSDDDDDDNGNDNGRKCAADAAFAQELQQQLDALDEQDLRTLQDKVSSDGGRDILHETRTSINAILQRQLNNAPITITNVTANEHSMPGCPLFEHFLETWCDVPDKTMKIVFHGSPEANIDAICRQGLDPARRAGQAMGAGEYFGIDIHTSLGYCRGGKKMLVFAVLVDPTGVTALQEHETRPNPGQFAAPAPPPGASSGAPTTAGVVVIHKAEHQLPLFVFDFVTRVPQPRAYIPPPVGFPGLGGFGAGAFGGAGFPAGWGGGFGAGAFGGAANGFGRQYGFGPCRKCGAARATRVCSAAACLNLRQLRKAAKLARQGADY